VKITDVTLTLFAWDNIPATTYGRHTGKFGGRSQLGLLTLRTDEGAEGHAFLGSASRGAQYDAGSLMSALKPLVMDQDPLDRERLYQALLSRSRQTTWRAIGAVDVALWDLAGKVTGLPIHRLLGSYRERLPAYASSAVLPNNIWSIPVLPWVPMTIMSAFLSFAVLMISTKGTPRTTNFSTSFTLVAISAAHLFISFHALFCISSTRSVTERDEGMYHSAMLMSWMT